MVYIYFIYLVFIVHVSVLSGVFAYDGIMSYVDMYIIYFCILVCFCTERDVNIVAMYSVV